MCQGAVGKSGFFIFHHYACNQFSHVYFLVPDINIRQKSRQDLFPYDQTIAEKQTRESYNVVLVMNLGSSKFKNHARQNKPTFITYVSWLSHKLFLVYRDEQASLVVGDSLDYLCV